MRLLLTVSALAFMMTQIDMARAASKFVYAHVVNGSSDCNNAKGNEVNLTKSIQAPSGSFFEKDAIQVKRESEFQSFVDNAGPSGCFARNMKTENIIITTKNNHTINYPVVTSFDVYGHSDCGSGEARTAEHILHHDRIRTDCSAEVTIYTQEDLK